MRIKCGDVYVDVNRGLGPRMLALYERLSAKAMTEDCERDAYLVAYAHAGLGIGARMKADFLRANPMWALCEETVRRFNAMGPDLGWPEIDPDWLEQCR